jgi:hypothetical protein
MLDQIAATLSRKTGNKNSREGYKRSHRATMRARASGIGLGALIWFGGNPVDDQTYDVSKITAANAIR